MPGPWDLYVFNGIIYLYVYYLPFFFGGGVENIKHALKK